MRRLLCRDYYLSKKKLICPIGIQTQAYFSIPTRTRSVPDMNRRPYKSPTTHWATVTNFARLMVDPR